MKIGLIGYPIEHSLSPMIFQEGFETYSITNKYVYQTKQGKDLKKVLTEMKKEGYIGFNVTMPFKIDILKHIDENDLDPLAKKIGAVNTVVIENGKLIGYNTDGLGVVNALKKVTNLVNKKVLLIGYGGAARAIGFTLKEEKAVITITGRNEEKSHEFAKELLGNSLPLNKIDSLKEFDILINATPVGMSGHREDEKSLIPIKLLKKGLIVFDIVYNPIETYLLKEAEKAGCITIRGTEMLLEQAFEGFKLLLKRKPPEEEMRKMLENHLKVAE